ncbi:TrkH family potassium uptake protein [Rhodovulum sp. YNF3179]|uniref:TrkH family potassium uptake protein n=1 Tax=Rhodovulum sp. YNF3179 TaxID=3425127 RepID=UPI003D345451
MFDLRPVGYVIGLLVAALGATMALPLALDLYDGSGHWAAFLESMVLTCLVGGLLALSCANGVRAGLGMQQTFLLTTGVWLALPVFAALPFSLGATEARYVDAFFEAMSGLTTTGSTVFSGLDDLPRGLLLWRSMLQWFGGIGIIVVAMVFLPELRVGGMQIFRSEAFDTMGKILPRAAQIALRISAIYIGLTLACTAAYAVVGMGGFDAVNHAMTTLATGGFSTRDGSFGDFRGAAEYIAAAFMILASLPFVRYVQMLDGQGRPILKDSQVRGFFAVIVALVLVLALYRTIVKLDPAEPAFREAVFNITSILTGTGYASTDYQLWGSFPVVLFFLAGLIGGCAGSTSCSVKIFRYQLLLASINAQIRRIHSPHGVFTPRYAGRPVGEDVLSSVMAFFMLFFVTLAVLALLLGMTGLDFITAVSGAATALANVGPGLGPEIGPAGNFGGLSDTAKWLLSAGMLIGRLELMAVYVILTLQFWRS